MFENTFLMSFIGFFIILTPLVFIHELGHYFAAIKSGVKVESFSIGFGPELIGFNDKNNTRWKFSLIPLGGYVKMFGEGEEISEDNDDSRKDQKLSDEEKAVSFQYKTLLQRSAIVFAGPLINFLFAIIAFAGIFMKVKDKYGGLKTPGGTFIDIGRFGLRRTIATHCALVLPSKVLFR